MIDNFEPNLGTKDITAFSPNCLGDVEEIIEYLKSNPLILNLSKLKDKNRQRFLDLITGAMCALDKNVCILDKENYLFFKK